MAKKLAVVGAGLMGAGIAQVSAQAGYEVVLRDVTEQALARGRDAIAASYGRFVAKGKLAADDAEAALARITTTTDLDAAADADLVVEAVFEKIEVKQEIFRTLDRLVGDDTVLASNTSAIPITKIAAATERPERVVGTHFFCAGADDAAVRTGPRLQDERRDAGRGPGSSPRAPARPVSSSTATWRASSPPG